MRFVQRHPDAVEATVESELVVMNIHSLDYYRLNSVAKRIWELLEEGALSDESICHTLLDEYEVTAEQCRLEVDTFLDSAVERGFLRPVDAA